MVDHSQTRIGRHDNRWRAAFVILAVVGSDTEINAVNNGVVIKTVDEVVGGEVQTGIAPWVIFNDSLN